MFWVYVVYSWTYTSIILVTENRDLVDKIVKSDASCQVVQMPVIP